MFLMSILYYKGIRESKLIYVCITLNLSFILKTVLIIKLKLKKIIIK